MQQAVPATVVEDLPPPPETIPETSEKVLTGGVRLYVQTGAFSSKGNALEQLGTLQKHAEKAFLVEVVKAGRTLHRVRSGPYASIAEADVMLAKLVDAGFNTAVIAIDR
ncbi:MAG: SPOR domain-containing protein [Alphaproteobacteria bacterium]|nr:SPOR domain-containing protein [Alphaproteobacteria bacterium]MDD9919335.1 SPOR domain-containing protein [Alphaproteobacteria bacterium]